MPTKKRKTPRETSDGISRKASAVLRDLRKRVPRIFDADGREMVMVYVDVLEPLAASCLAQDQTRGPRGRK